MYRSTTAARITRNPGGIGEGMMSMGVYIDVEMPKEGFVEILIRDDGTVQQTGQSYRIDGTDYYTPYIGEMPVMYKAVPVPPHGRLGDLDNLRKKFETICDRYDAGIISVGVCMNLMLQAVISAPTIIPASEEGEI